MAKKPPRTPENAPAPKRSAGKPAARKSAPTATDTATVDLPGEAIRPVQIALPPEPARSAEQATRSTDQTDPTGHTDNPARREVDHQQIAERAYALYTLGTPGSPTDHWLQAERELRST